MNAAQVIDHFDRLCDAPDAIPRLRRFILDLAVRGKLVEQDPTDEPASELLERIQAEKARLVKEGKIRDRKIVDHSADGSGIFPLPSLWTWCRLSEVGAIIGGGTPPSADWDNFTGAGSGIAWLTPADLGKQSDPYVSRGSRDLTQQGLRSSSATLMPKGSVLFTSRAPIGYTAIAANEVSTNQGFKSVVPYILDCNLYIAVYFRAFCKWIDGKASGTTFREVSGKIVGSLPFPLPPLAEQHRIVATVDELMALCDRLEAAQTERESRRDKLAVASLHRLNNGADADEFREHARFHLRHLPRVTTRPEHIQQLRQTILNLAVRGKLVPQDPNDEPAYKLLKRIRTWRATAIAEGKLRMPRKQLLLIEESEAPYELPSLWNWVRLGQIIYIHSGNGLTAETMRYGSVPVFGGNGIAGFHDTPNVLRPTVVIGRVGYYCGSIHVTPSEAWITDNAFITQFCTDAVFQNFLVLLLKATNLKENEKATAQPVISGAKIYPIIVGLPPFAEQHRIVAKVDELMALCDCLEAQLTTTQRESRRLVEAVLHEVLS